MPGLFPQEAHPPGYPPPDEEVAPPVESGRAELSAGTPEELGSRIVPGGSPVLSPGVAGGRPRFVPLPAADGLVVDGTLVIVSAPQAGIATSVNPAATKPIVVSFILGLLGQFAQGGSTNVGQHGSCMPTKRLRRL